MFFFVQCYEFDKFEGYATESEAVARGLQLMNSSLLWAVIVFKHEDLSASATQLPRHVTYKLRYKLHFVEFNRLKFK